MGLRSSMPLLGTQGKGCGKRPLESRLRSLEMHMYSSSSTEATAENLYTLSAELCAVHQIITCSLQ